MTTAAPVVKPARFALVGNPNVGKTSLFNAMTGLSAKVGNYAGVTVEKKIGTVQIDGLGVELVDLPGIYTLAAHSPDELVAFSILADEGPQGVDGVVVLLDASNLERNLYLYTQLLAFKRPLVVALNMMDVAAEQQVAIDVPLLRARLGVPVVVVNAAKRSGLVELKAELKGLLAGGDQPHGAGPDLGDAFASEVGDLVAWATARGRTGWPAFKVMRALIDVGGHLEKHFAQDFGPEGLTALETSRTRIGATPVPAAHEARVRYAWVHALLDGVIERPERRVSTLSDRIDAVLTHPILGLGIFTLLMALIFQSIYTWSAPLMDGIEAVFKALGHGVGTFLPPGPLQSLLVDGVIAGIGSVLMFLPQIAILFLFVHLLEDCGYMARAAFLMDRVMNKAGLSGKSFIPMLSGFACAVPSIMATRTIENRRDRLATILALPLMSCSARLPVYTIMIGAFIPQMRVFGLDLRGLVLFGIYIAGLVLAIPLIWLLKRTVLKGETPTILMEMPSYKLPGVRVVGLGVWRQCRSFLERAGTVILLLTVLIWAGAYFPHHATAVASLEAQRPAITAQGPAKAKQLEAAIQAAYVEDSYLARVGKTIQPVFAPMGWDWRITTGVLASFPAREVIVATLGTLYSLGSDADQDKLLTTLQTAKHPDGTPAFTIAVAMSVMVFFALCLQCASTLSVMWRETGSWKWPAVAFTFQTALAYVGALAVFLALKGL
ncbi:MAG: feoB [Cyanobacteria bacterium RYN_339]|nr:feoB [Cyanobacteria bacterium RYN_339]